MLAGQSVVHEQSMIGASGSSCSVGVEPKYRGVLVSKRICLHSGCVSVSSLLQSTVIYIGALIPADLNALSCSPRRSKERFGCTVPTFVG